VISCLHSFRVSTFSETYTPCLAMLLPAGLKIGYTNYPVVLPQHRFQAFVPSSPRQRERKPHPTRSESCHRKFQTWPVNGQKSVVPLQSINTGILRRGTNSFPEVQVRTCSPTSPLLCTSWFAFTAKKGDRDERPMIVTSPAWVRWSTRPSIDRASPKSMIHVHDIEFYSDCIIYCTSSWNSCG
jgi:hypothetical protein